MPPSLRSWLNREIPTDQFSGDIPWTALEKPLKEVTFSLMTSAGITAKSSPPFNVEHEEREPRWGDTGSRGIPKTATTTDINVNHLPINTEYIKQDVNVRLPLAEFREFEKEGIIGRYAPTCYSYYGFQPDPKILLVETMPKVADKMPAEKVEAELLMPP